MNEEESMARNIVQKGFHAGALWVVLVFAFLYLPIIIFFIFSFNNASFPAPWAGFTLTWYRQLWTESSAWLALYHSLLVAGSSVLLSLCLGTFLIFFVTQSERVERLLVQFYANLIFPEIVLAVGLLSMFTVLGVGLGLGTLVVAHTVLGLGYAVPFLYGRYCELDYRLVEASRDLGASPWQTFSMVILPLIKSTIFAAGILVFIISFDDFVFAYFCAGGEFQTFPLYVLSMLRTGVSPVVNAISTILLVCSSLLIVIYSSLKTKHSSGIW
jgi:spermidine/putrescine transport system permease protein